MPTAFYIAVGIIGVLVCIGVGSVIVFAGCCAAAWATRLREKLTMDLEAERRAAWEPEEDQRA